MVGKSRSNTQVLSGLAIVLTGVLFATLHVINTVQNVGPVAKLVGGVIPLVLSLGIVGTGVWVTRTHWEDDATFRVVAWLLIGMTWMSIVGVGSFVYGIAGEPSITRAGLLVAIFCTYGSVPGIITGLYDGQRQQRKRELERQELAMESAIDGMAILDEGGEFLYLNRAYAEMYGYESPSELLGTSWQSRHSETEAERFESEIMPVLRTTGSYRGRATGLRRDGTSFPQQLSLSTIAGGGMVCVCRDVSDRDDRERAFSVLNRVLRHNLRNELNVISGQAERIASGSSTVACGATSQIRETAVDLLELAEKERQIADLVLREPKPDPMDVGSILDHAIAEIEGRYPEARISRNDGQYPAVLAIPELELAVVELVENAIVHNDVENPWVGLSVDAEDDRLSISISDNGPRIPAQERNVIVGDRDIEALYHGSGLGLWYVYWVVRNLGGIIEFDDRDPRGSVVTVVLQTAGQ